MKKQLLALGAALLLTPALTACSSFNDTMLFLYGGDAFVQEEGTAYTEYDGENGVSLVYDAHVWEAPVMAQADTISLTSGNRISYTAVLLQNGGDYTDFLAQSGEELAAENNAIEYEFDFTVPQADVSAVRYDCGSYQAIFAQLDYDSGTTIYVTAATKSGSYDQITDLLQNVYPTGQAPDNALALLTPETAQEG